MKGVRRRIVGNLKNFSGWSTRRKIVIFSVDDYGNVHVASRSAWEALLQKGLPMTANQFVRLDALENVSDLEGLFETLRSVKDCNGHHAVFTAFALPANIDFETMDSTGYSAYAYEALPRTFEKVPGYEGAWTTWKQGQYEGLIHPEYHGREHVNIRMLMRLLSSSDQRVLECFNQRSYAAIVDNENTLESYGAAFSVSSKEEALELVPVIKEGLDLFEKVFGHRAMHFNAPGKREPKLLHAALKDGGISLIDTDFISRKRIGDEIPGRRVNFSGQLNELGQTYVVRNSVFEPAVNGTDWVDCCMDSIQQAFHWGRPANISSHRVNYCGQIDPANRDNGLKELKRLLKTIVTQWPDVEFMTSVQAWKTIVKEKAGK